MDEAQPAAPDCPCRPWLEAELATLRADLAQQLQTARLVVGSPVQGMVVIEAGPDAVGVEVHAPAVGGHDLRVELLASADLVEGYAGLSITSDGDVVSVYALVEPHHDRHGVVRLLFDRPRTSGPWTVVDINGLREER